MSEQQLDILNEPVGPVGKRRNVFVGTCSWTDPSLIKAGTFYPKGFSTPEKRLRYYASQFPIVEVDSSFFAMPSAVNSQLWVERTPPSFRFNIKSFRLFTGHQTAPASFPKDLQPLLPALTGRKKNYYYADVPEDIRNELWRRFIEALAPLKNAGKLKAVHFQFAPWATASPQWSSHVEHCVERMSGHLLAVEFRNQTWLSEGSRDRTFAWEKDMGVVHVVVDEPVGVGNYAHGVWATTHPDLALVRLHGRNAETWNAKSLAASSDRFNYVYTDQELAELTARMQQLAEDAFELHALVNVNYEDQGVVAARRLIELLQAHRQDG